MIVSVVMQAATSLANTKTRNRGKLLKILIINLLGLIHLSANRNLKMKYLADNLPQS